MKQSELSLALRCQKNYAHYQEQVRDRIREEIKVGDIYKIIEAKEVMLDRSSGYISFLCVDERTNKCVWLPLPTIYQSTGSLKTAVIDEKIVPIMDCTFEVTRKETKEVKLRGLDTEVHITKNFYEFTLLAY